MRERKTIQLASGIIFKESLPANCKTFPIASMFTKKLAETFASVKTC